MGVAVGITYPVVRLVSNHTYFLVMSLCLYEYMRAYVRYMLIALYASTCSINRLDTHQSGVETVAAGAAMAATLFGQEN